MKIVPTPIASWLPLSPMKIKREGFKGLHMENQFFCDVKYLVASISKY